LDEGEVLLPPGSRFRVVGMLQQTDLTIVQLQELPSEEWILKLPQGSTADMLEQQLRQTEQDLGVAVQKLMDERMEKETAQQKCRELEKERALAEEQLTLCEAREQQLQDIRHDLKQELRWTEQTRGEALQKLTDERMAREIAEQKCQELEKERTLAKEQLASCEAREQQLQHIRFDLKQELQHTEQALAEALQNLSDQKKKAEALHNLSDIKELAEALQKLSDNNLSFDEAMQNGLVLQALSEKKTTAEALQNLLDLAEQCRRLRHHE